MVTDGQFYHSNVTKHIFIVTFFTRGFSAFALVGQGITSCCRVEQPPRHFILPAYVYCDNRETDLNKQLARGLGLCRFVW